LKTPASTPSAPASAQSYFQASASVRSTKCSPRARLAGLFIRTYGRIYIYACYVQESLSVGSTEWLPPVITWLAYLYIHTYIHIYMHACIHIYIHTCIHAYMHTCIDTYIHTCYFQGSVLVPSTKCWCVGPSGNGVWGLKLLVCRALSVLVLSTKCLPRAHLY